MKHFLISLGLFAGMLPLIPAEASAMVCARGVYRAGCVGPNGAVAVHRGFVGRWGGIHRPQVGMYGRGARGVAFRGGGFRGGFRR
jgi:hypothetical protein